MKYISQPVPLTFTALPAFLAREFKRLSQLWGTEVTLPTTTDEPSNAVDGMIVYADGVTWNPGAGAGFYGRVSSAWVKL